MGGTLELVTAAMPAHRRRILQVLSLLAGLGALGVMFALFGVDDVADALTGLSPQFLGFYLVLAILVRLGFSLRWFLVARAFGRAPSFPRFLAARLAGDAVGALIPTGSVGGDPLRIGLLYGRGVAGTRASAGVALDRSMELVGNTLCAVTYVTIFFLGQAVRETGGSGLNLGVVTAPLLLLLASLALPFVLMAFGVRPLSLLLPRRLGQWPRGRLVLELVARTEDELMTFVRQRPLLLLGGIIGSLAIEGLVVGEYYCLLAAFGLRMDLPTLLMMLVTVGLVRAVPIPAGLGALEVGQVTLMAAAQGRGDLGFLVGLVMRLHETLWIAVGLATLALQGLSLASLQETASLKKPHSEGSIP